MILELKKFESFPAVDILTDSTERTELGMDNIVSAKDLKVDLKIQKTGEEFYCQGSLEAHVKLECARCLSEFNQIVRNEMDFIVMPSGGSDQSDSGIMDDEDHAYYDGDLRADLRDLVRQALILSVSMKPLCLKDCKGLCQQCGCNLNETQCDCRQEALDPRLAVLKNVYSEKISGEGKR